MTPACFGREAAASLRRTSSDAEWRKNGKGKRRIWCFLKRKVSFCPFDGASSERDGLLSSSSEHENHASPYDNACSADMCASSLYLLSFPWIEPAPAPSLSRKPPSTKLTAFDYRLRAESCQGNTPLLIFLQKLLIPWITSDKIFLTNPQKLSTFVNNNVDNGFF